VLDRVERGRILEQPAREDLVPAELLGGAAAFLDECLNEGALFLGLLPGKRLLASGDLDHEVADPACLARLHHQVLGQVVALVEDAQRDHAVLVGRADLLALGGLGRPCLHPGDRIGNAGILRLGRRLALAAAGQQRQQDENRRKGGKSLHESSQASGDQAS